jgi:uncharacterized protein (TIGR03382 family)
MTATAAARADLEERRRRGRGMQAALPAGSNARPPRPASGTDEVANEAFSEAGPLPALAVGAVATGVWLRRRRRRT